MRIMSFPMWHAVDSLKFFENEIIPGQEDKLRKYETILGAENKLCKDPFSPKENQDTWHFLFWVSYWKKSSLRNKSHGSNSLWGLVWRSCWQSRGLFDIAFVWLEGSWSPTAASVGSVKAKIRFLTLLLEIRAPFSGIEYFYSQPNVKKSKQELDRKSLQLSSLHILLLEVLTYLYDTTSNKSWKQSSTMAVPAVECRSALQWSVGIASGRGLSKIKIFLWELFVHTFIIFSQTMDVCMNQVLY